MNDDEPISPWYFAGRSVRYRKNCKTGEITMQIKDGEVWRDMTEQEREAWIRMNTPPPAGK